MRVLVMGAGVVAAAWQLLEDGHEVTVIERRDEAAAETSFANAGLVAPGHAFAWASPQSARTLLKSLIRNMDRCACDSGPSPRSGAGRCSSWPSAPARGRAASAGDLIAGRTADLPLEGLTLR